MKIDGRGLSNTILTDLTRTVQSHHLIPGLAVIVVGNDPGSLAYIKQKQLATERIGGRFVLERLPLTTTEQELFARVGMFEKDPHIHGLIVQRPIPSGIRTRVSIKKDIDGFEDGSPFDVPIAMAIFTILESIHLDFKGKSIVIVGRGQTAGEPIAKAFVEKQCATSVVHSTTPRPEDIMKSADILISCVGKPVIKKENIKPGACLLSVGIWRDERGKLHGDYEEDEIKSIARWYTPTPGGVGPVNIACLMQNLVKACMMKV